MYMFALTFCFSFALSATRSIVGDTSVLNVSDIPNISIPICDALNSSSLCSKKPVMIEHHAHQMIFYINSERVPQQTQFKCRSDLGFSRSPGIGCHKLHRRKMTWNKARNICIDEGAHLAIINSKTEETVLMRDMNEQNVDMAWLGLHDMFEEGDWTTVLDYPMEASGYARWTAKIPNDPDNHGGKQNCAVLLRDGGGMDDIECTTNFSFFCEMTDESQ